MTSPREESFPPTAPRSWLSLFGSRTSLQSPREDQSTEQQPTVVFGAPLRTALQYTTVPISLAKENGEQYVWGYVPALVAKTGLFLKQNGVEVEGVFRVGGSEKRMRELQDIFNTPPNVCDMSRH